MRCGGAAWRAAASARITPTMMHTDGRLKLNDALQQGVVNSIESGHFCCCLVSGCSAGVATRARRCGWGWDLLCMLRGARGNQIPIPRRWLALALVPVIRCVSAFAERLYKHSCGRSVCIRLRSSRHAFTSTKSGLWRVASQDDNCPRVPNADQNDR